MEQIPVSFIPRLGNTVTWVAFVLGVMLYVIGYFGGIRQNFAKMITSVFVATLIGVLARPLANTVHLFLASQVSLKLAGFVVPILWMAFILGVAVSLYETFTVTAKEAHPFY